MRAWTKHHSTGQLLVWNAMLSLPGMLVWIFFSRFWWVGALLVVVSLVRILQAVVAGRKRNERERALLERLSK